MPILTTCLTAFREDVLVKRIRRALFRDARAGQGEGVQLRLLLGGAYHRAKDSRHPNHAGRASRPGRSRHGLQALA
jgi:hypothetical protein